MNARGVAPASTEIDEAQSAVDSGTPFLAPLAPAVHRGLVDPSRLLKGAAWTRIRLGTDASLLLLALLAATIGAPAADVSSDGELLVWAYPPLVLALFGLRGLYHREFHVRLLDGLWQVLGATSLAAIALIALAAFAEPSADPAPLLARAWFFAAVYLMGGRLLLSWVQRRARTNMIVGKPTLVIGAGHIGSQVERRLEEQPELGLRLVGYLDWDPPPLDMVPGRRAPVLGSPDQLGEVVEATGAEHVVLAFTSSPDRVLTPLVRECEERGLELTLVPRLFESVNVRLEVEHVGGLPLLGLHSVNPKGWQFAVKHLFDRLGAALLVILLSPLMLALALGVLLSSPGPVLFRQRRIGRDGRDFEMLKFRSMRPAPATPTTTPAGDTAPGGVEGDDRRTRFGAFMRSTSLDELPQLFNVLRGQMSLVGPRPERPDYVEFFGQRLRRYEDRHRVKSGVTGWAQVHGLRGKTSLVDRVEWDNYYIENWSLSLDFRILLMTLAAIFRAAE